MADVCVCVCVGGVGDNTGLVCQLLCVRIHTCILCACACLAYGVWCAVCVLYVCAWLAYGV